MKKEHDTLAIRLAQILTKLNNGERFSAKELADEFNVNLRTIQRDLKERLAYFPIIKEDGYYKMDGYALGKLSFDDIKNFAQLSGITSLYPSLSNGFISDILNVKLNRAYLVKNKGFENITQHKEIFEKISAAILKCSPISFVYKDKKRVVKPYKLVNTNGVWYLLAEEENRLKTFTFSKLEKLEWNDETKTFAPNIGFLEKIAADDSNWFSDTNVEVVLEIANEAKEYFLRKEVFASQEIIKENETSFLVSVHVSFDDELLTTVQYWIPYIKIISPIHLQEKLHKKLTEYLQMTKTIKY